MADLFDTLMTKTCDILVEDPDATPNAYNQTSGDPLVVQQAAVACRVDVDSKGREFKVGKQSSISTHIIFMRPTTVTPHNTIECEGLRYNVLDVQNPGGVDHHYELFCEQVKP